MTATADLDVATRGGRAARAPTTRPADPLWYKDAVIYELHVKAFFDSNGDGIGDFAGLTSKLDYVHELGVTAIWLLPFYPSPFRDDGYDVADYHNVHPSYGTRYDFRQFVREAHRRDIRVITELVINHTSDQHPWFQAARRAPKGSAKRDFYVWSDDPNRYAGTRIIFTDAEKSNWTWDEVAQAYYWHRFFHHQPDLNFDNPQVLKAVIRTMRFWLDMGVDGFRLDAIPYLVEREGTNNENLRETHAVIKHIRANLDAHYSGRVLLAEANQWPEDVSEYFGGGDECHMAYHFPLMPRIYMALAQEDRHPITEIMWQTPEIPDNCQWAIFLRNHDELTLEMVTSKERDYMYNMYAADKRARINLGIRRRLAPLVENDLDRIKLMNSLLFSMPGSPIIYYGDEIGMGDNIFLGDRDGVRTPMQWTSDRNGGFSRADPQRLYLPPIMDPVYGFEAVNVEAQQRDQWSMLNWMKRLIAVRRSSQAFGRGRLTFLSPGNRKVLAFLRELGDEAILCVANLARSAQPVELDLARYKGRVPVELMGRTPFPPIGDLPYLLTLPSCSFYWFRLATDVPVPSWHSERTAPEELTVLVLFDGWSSLFRDRVVPWRIGMAEKLCRQFEGDVLPRYFEKQRWYGGKGEPLKRVTLADYGHLRQGRYDWLLTTVNVDSGGQPATYFMPLALAWEEQDEDRLPVLAPLAIAKVRQQAQVGLLSDALADEPFCLALVDAIEQGSQIPMARGRVLFRATRAFAQLAGTAAERRPVQRPPASSSNTALALGERLFLKAYRRLQRGVNPELEIGRYLTDVVQFPHCVPVAGSVEYVDADGAVMTLALLQAYVTNQGDGWTYSVDYLARTLESYRSWAGEPIDDSYFGSYTPLMRTLGRRLAQLHLALASSTKDPVFAPEPITREDYESWLQRLQSEAAATFGLLQKRIASLDPEARVAADEVMTQATHLLERLALPPSVAGQKIRHHGDFHLGQVLIRDNDFLIIDFEGEPARPLEERRRKHSPLRDVAGMLRSFNYASAAALEKALPAAADRNRLAPVAHAWERLTRRTFLDAYFETVAGSELYPLPEVLDPLLRLFETDKALYEARYELENRPNWVDIPLRGIARLLERKP
jgi:maltose alpha-D-glucosyltransferase/alpha-amylase